MTFYAGHNSDYGHWVRFSTGSFAASSSVGDSYLNDFLAQNSEFLFACTSEIKVNISRFIEPLEMVISSSQTLLTSVGPFNIEFLPDGTPQPVFVSVIANSSNDTNAFITCSLTVHLRQAQNRIGTLYSYSEFGTVILSGSTDNDRLFTVASSSISPSSSVLEIHPKHVGSLKTYAAYTSRSLSATREAVYTLPVYLDFFGTPTGSSTGDEGTVSFKQIFAQTIVPRISGSW